MADENCRSGLDRDIVRVRCIGPDGAADYRWMEISHLANAPSLSNAPLSNQQLTRVHRLHVRLGPLDTLSLREREECFLSEFDPDNELSVAELIADVVDNVCAEIPEVTIEQRCEIYQLV